MGEKKLEVKQVTIIDATNLILGRMSSSVAKRLLQGEHVVILNAEKAVISGGRKNRVKEAKESLKIGHPWKGPFHPRRPDRLVRRTIRGMLPWKKPKGKQAYKRLRVFLGVPEKFEGKKALTIPHAMSKKLKCSYLTVGELAKEIGWNPRGR
ncbi:MAG: 50S ribosomal protein L13 [Thermoproteota archaeon]|nr:50S ribosomal protein L13 [Thermoproteota archaeon]